MTEQKPLRQQIIEPEMIESGAECAELVGSVVEITIVSGRSHTVYVGRLVYLKDHHRDGQITRTYVTLERETISLDWSVVNTEDTSIRRVTTDADRRIPTTNLATGGLPLPSRLI